jgi:spore coat polysaccharide biosynthesis protein SpsF
MSATAAAPRVLAVLQARQSSTRLPGKVLLPVLGEPMLARQIERIRRARRLDGLVVATTDQPEDEAIAALCAGLGVDCFRGALADVLDRFYQAARTRSPEHVVRLTGDCPLSDPALVDAAVALHLAGGFDYSGNAVERSYPDGLDVEVFTFALLERAWREAATPHEREHVTPYMYAGGHGFRLGVLRDTLDRSALRWTVDRPEDYAFVCRVFEALHPGDPAFSAADVHRFLDRHPEVAALNAHLSAYPSGAAG